MNTTNHPPRVSRNKVGTPSLLPPGLTDGPLERLKFLSDLDPPIPLPPDQAEQLDRFGVELKDGVSQHYSSYTLP